MLYIYVISVILALLVSVLVGCAINSIVRSKRRKEFADKHGLDKLPKHFIVKKYKSPVVANECVLGFPEWEYANKDGSMNMVRKYNELIYYENILYFGHYTVTTKYPSSMNRLVNILRDKYGDRSIKMNRQEREKYIRLKNKYEQINRCNSIQSIINEFSDEPTEFEVFCASLLCKMGYKTAVTQKTNDGGYDIVMQKGEYKYIVECKCYSQRHSVGRPTVQKLVGANQEAKADHMLIITTSGYSKEAQSYAKIAGVELIDGDKLLQLVLAYNGVKQIEVVIPRREWALTKRDLQKYYPPDVEV